MHLSKSALLIAAAAFIGLSSLAAQPASPAPAAPPAGAPQPRMGPPRERTSPHATISARIGDRRTGNFVMVTYGRPYTKDPKTGEPRVVWGGLVSWDKAWRLGANEATLFVTNKPIVIGAKTIPAGAYTLYLVPSESGPAKLAFSTNIGKWGVPVDESRDLVRVDMQKSMIDSPVDQLTIAVENDPAAGGVLKITWEKTQYSVAFAEAK